MKITKKQYQKIEPLLPKLRGNFVVEHLKVLNAILYVAENGCKWRALPRRYGHGTRSIVAFDAGPRTAFCRRCWKFFKRKSLSAPIFRFYRWTRRS
ncbi:MAG: transposase [Thermoguttaceae bacterium]|nr:transposase [Thermoguttaceae bacterium]